MALEFYKENENSHYGWIYIYTRNGASGYYTAIINAIYNTSHIQSATILTSIEAIKYIEDTYPPTDKIYALNYIKKLIKEDFYKDLLDEN